MEVQDHFPILEMPGAQYVTHVSPEDGTVVCLAKELEDVVRTEQMPLKVVGMDRCPTITGPHTGAIRMFELLLNITLQWVICGLHLPELLWWHILTTADGGPVGLST